MKCTLLIGFLLTSGSLVAIAAIAIGSWTRIFMQRVCYADVGCFTNDGHFFDLFRRPISMLPQSPEEINVTFILLTRRNRKEPQIMTQYSRNSVFNPRKDTKVRVRVTWLTLHHLCCSSSSMGTSTTRILVNGSTNWRTKCSFMMTTTSS